MMAAAFRVEDALVQLGPVALPVEAGAQDRGLAFRTIRVALPDWCVFHAFQDTSMFDLMGAAAGAML